MMSTKEFNKTALDEKMLSGVTGGELADYFADYPEDDYPYTVERTTVVVTGSGLLVVKTDDESDDSQQ